MPANAKPAGDFSASIMLVEDSLADQILIRRALEDANINCKLITAFNGVEALNLLREKLDLLAQQDGRFQLLILLDINMPHMDGMETLKAIRNTSEFKHLPVVMLTTSSSESDIKKAYDHGANAYLTKPVEEKDFVNIARKIEEFWFNLAKLPAL